MRPSVKGARVLVRPLSSMMQSGCSARRYSRRNGRPRSCAPDPDDQGRPAADWDHREGRPAKRNMLINRIERMMQGVARSVMNG